MSIAPGEYALRPAVARLCRIQDRRSGLRTQAVGRARLRSSLREGSSWTEGTPPSCDLATRGTSAAAKVPHIVVDDRQARVISEAAQTVEIRDQHGNRLGYVAQPFTDEDFAVAKRRLQSDEPRFTTQEVLNHLRSLEPE